MLKKTTTTKKNGAINGLYPNQPAHSSEDIRDSGDSRGDGEYWIDPEKTGNPMKVYCDMTTDRGKLRIMICKGELSKILAWSVKNLHSFPLYLIIIIIIIIIMVMIMIMIMIIIILIIIIIRFY